jgi:hypothetical protein
MTQVQYVWINLSPSPIHTNYVTWSMAIFFIYKSCAWKKIPMNHHRSVFQFNKKIKTFIQINVHFWKNIYNCVCHWKYFKNQFFFPPNWTNINKIWNIEINVCAMIKVKYGLDRDFTSSGLVWWQWNWYPSWGSKDQTSQMT